MIILPNATYRFNVIPIKLPIAFFTELAQKISQFIWKPKRPWIAKAVLWKKNEVGGINLPDFRLYHKATVIKRVWYWYKDRNIDVEQDRKPETHPHTLSLTKEARIYNEEKIVSSISGAGEHWTATLKRMKWDTSNTMHKEKKWFKDLNVRPETIKPLEENIGRTL